MKEKADLQIAIGKLSRQMNDLTLQLEIIEQEIEALIKAEVEK